jgi:WD40 repeat protein/mono/diheme cytochrome c family protein
MITPSRNLRPNLRAFWLLALDWVTALLNRRPLFPDGVLQPVPWFFIFFAALPLATAEPSKPDFANVQALFEKHCLDCHESKDPEGELILENYQTLLKGGETGPAVVPRKSAESLLLKMVQGTFEKDGKKKFMPPGKREKLNQEEVALIKAWIDAGANPPAEVKAKELVTPKIVPRVPPKDPIFALAYASANKLLAYARHGKVELVSAEHRGLLRTLPGHRGPVNAVVFSSDGKQLFAAAGEAGLFGEVRQWDTASGKLVRVFEGHKDALYALAISPDGKTLATGSYDQKIKLWDAATGNEIKTLSGHNGAVYGLAFRPDGKILASASADRTVKLWDVATGERRDTLSQSLKELYTVAFSPDGKLLAAAGVDNRIRVWQISEKALETSNPLIHARFAHEGALLRLAFSQDGKLLLSSAADKTVKIWDPTEMKERLVLPVQSDWPSALTFAGSAQVVVGKLDGSVDFYDTTSGKVLPPPKPELTGVVPRGLQRGVTTRIKLSGSNLVHLTELKLGNSKIDGRLDQTNGASPTEAWASITPAANLPRGTYEVSVSSAGGESSRLKLFVDDLPQFIETSATDVSTIISNLPASCWGVLNPAGDVDTFAFEAKTGQTYVFDLNAKLLGSKADAVLTLTDADGKVLASNSGYEGGDPFLAYTFPKDGRYEVRVSDLQLGASTEHFYRLSLGALPYVVGSFPMSIGTNSDSEVQLIGFNLPPTASIKVKPGKPGEMDLPLDSEKFRSRRAFKLLVGADSEALEKEPNDEPAQATPIPAPSAVSGRIFSARGNPDVDLYRFSAQKGRSWIIETLAARRGSPVDTKIEILHADGQPVERALLQAVRDSAITFRGIDSNSPDCRVDNWEEMELNEFLYLQGEVVKIFRMPQGPDSGFLFYTSSGKRRAFFDTSAASHALDEPCYVVEPHPPGSKLASTGLPIFKLFYANDDDGERKLGADSRLNFIAPTNGDYLVRVSDTRGIGGDRFVYRLVLREAKPDFQVTLAGANPALPAGSGQSFTVSAERLDGFEGEIRVDITGLPPGFAASTPLIIQPGQSEARGTVYANPDAPQPTSTNAMASKVIASATINGMEVKHEANNLGTIKLAAKPKLLVALEPSQTSASTNTSPTNQPLEITIAPGQTVPAWLKVQRNGYDDLVTFTVDNLPHGIIVDNIGLNGVLIPKAQNDREIFLTAAKWVPEQDRFCFAIENQAGRQTSRPVLLHVRKPGPKVSASTK